MRHLYLQNLKRALGKRRNMYNYDKFNSIIKGLSYKDSNVESFVCEKDEWIIGIGNIKEDGLRNLPFLRQQ